MCFFTSPAEGAARRREPSKDGARDADVAEALGCSFVGRQVELGDWHDRPVAIATPIDGDGRRATLQEGLGEPGAPAEDLDAPWA
eukprot:6992093-Alexandrium_andersonii.AAC.1